MNLPNSKKIPIFLFVLLCLFSIKFSPASAASGSFSTSGGGNAVAGQTVKVTVSANGNSSYNAVSVSTTFTNMTFISAAASGGWTPVSGPSNSGGTVSFSGAVLGNSYTNNRAVMTLTLRVGSSGTATVKSSGQIGFLEGGTPNVGGNTVTYTIAPPPTPTATPKPAASAVTLSSTSHPDQGKWYNNRQAVFNWNKANGVTAFSYQLTQDPNTTPDDTSEGDGTSISLPNLPEGKSYFHIKAKNDVGWSSVSRFAIQIDATNPDPFTPTLVTDQGKLYFSTNDLSGISRYNISVDGQDLGDKQTGIEVSKNAKKIIVTAYDNAGNTQAGVIDLETKQQAPAGVLNELTKVGASNDNSTTISQNKDSSLFQKYGNLITAAITLILVIGLGGGLALYRKIRNKGRLIK